MVVVLWFCGHRMQAILISMCLQGMVDELIMKKEGRKIMRVTKRLLLLFIAHTASAFLLIILSLSSHNNE